MRTAKTKMSRIAIWLVHAAIMSWIVLTLGCGAKKGGDTSLLPGKTIQDAGVGAVRDAKSDGAKTTGVMIGSIDAAFVDATRLPVEAGPKPTIVSISVSPPETIVAPLGRLTLKVTAVYSDMTTLDVTSAAQLTSSDSKIATVAGSVVTAVSAGKVVIVAALNDLFAFSNITVGQATVVSISLSPSPLTVYSGSFFPFAVTATAAMSDGSQKDVTNEVTWTSADSTIVVVSASGQAQGLSTGSTKITATLGQVKADVTVQVYGPTLKHLTAQARPPVAHPGDIVTVDVIATFDNGGSFSIGPAATLESSNPAVLKLSGTGSGIAVSAGKTVVTVKLGDQTVGTVEVVVTNATLTRIELVPAQLSIDYPNRGHLTANGVFSDQSRYDFTQVVTLSSDNNDIVTTDQGDGVLIPNGIGSATVSAYYDSLTASAAVTVTAGTPASLDITSGPITVPNYGGFGVSANVTYADGTALDVTKAVTWYSDDLAIVSPVAAPSTSGQFVGGHAGSTKIRAKFGTLTSRDVDVVVTDVQLLAIDLGNAHFYVSVGSTYESVTASGTFQDGSEDDITRSVVWKTGNPAIATISNDPNSVGVVTGVMSGTTSLTATLGNVSATATVTVQ